jgi:hypothetical protein
VQEQGQEQQQRGVMASENVYGSVPLRNTQPTGHLDSSCLLLQGVCCVYGHHCVAWVCAQLMLCWHVPAVTAGALLAVSKLHKRAADRSCAGVSAACTRRRVEPTVS